VTVDLVRRWFNKLPNYEKDLPLLIVNGTAYTPQAALTEVERNTELGRKLQALIEQKSIGTTLAEEATLAKIRLKEILKTMPEKPLFATLILPARTWTPHEIEREIQEDTPIGKRWLKAEKAQMEYLVGIR